MSLSKNLNFIFLNFRKSPRIFTSFTQPTPKNLILMSSQNSILAGIAGAAIASAIWYFAGSTGSTENKSDEATPADGGMKQMALGVQVPCPQQNAKAISWTQAQKLVTFYVDPSNTRQLLNDKGALLKGWYLDKCIIQNLFDIYPSADGLQIYIGADTLPGGVIYNKLVWMASQLFVNPQTGQTERENCIDKPNTVIDMTEPCPTDCPAKNDLP